MDIIIFLDLLFMLLIILLTAYISISLDENLGTLTISTNRVGMNKGNAGKHEAKEELKEMEKSETYNENHSEFINLLQANVDDIPIPDSAILKRACTSDGRVAVGWFIVKDTYWESIASMYEEFLYPYSKYPSLGMDEFNDPLFRGKTFGAVVNGVSIVISAAEVKENNGDTLLSISYGSS